MTSSVIRKYARALVEVASEQGKPDRVLAELRAFRDILQEHEKLSEVLNNPALPFASKRTIIEAGWVLRFLLIRLLCTLF
jgi:F-type H+-transporting ATPase subunit delta